jgi:hypothetical protein
MLPKLLNQEVALDRPAAGPRRRPVELVLFSILPEDDFLREWKSCERTLKRELVSRFAHRLLDVFRCGWTFGQGVLVEALCRALVKEKMDRLINNDSAFEFVILWGALIT